MASILTTQKAPIVDEAGEQLGAVGQELYHLASDDNTVGSVDWIDWRPWFTAHGAGTCTVSGTRLADGATTTLSVLVTEPVLGTFVIDLGPAVTK